MKNLHLYLKVVADWGESGTVENPRRDRGEEKRGRAARLAANVSILPR